MVLKQQGSRQSDIGLPRARHCAGGFTLVEIMIVVAVIGLLALIAIPNFRKHRNSARVKVCMENLRVLDGAMAQWGLDARKSTTSIPSTTDVIPY
jgi:prepilin-type N-terminal cleavage/methylation domain-containing protein